MTAITKDDPVYCGNPHDAHVAEKLDHDQRVLWQSIHQEGQAQYSAHLARDNSVLQAALDPAPQRVPRIATFGEPTATALSPEQALHVQRTLQDALAHAPQSVPRTAIFVEPTATAQASDIAAPVTPIEGAVALPGAPVTPEWTLTKPKRFQGYTEPLYLLLEVAHIAGQPIPKPREVLQAFAKEQPSQIASVTGGESLNYYLADGTTIRTANLKAIRGAIAAMTGKSQNSPA